MPLFGTTREEYRRQLEDRLCAITPLMRGAEWTETLLLRSRNVRTNSGRTLVPRKKLDVRYTLEEGGFIHCACIWPDEYLRAIRTGRLGAMQFAALQIVGGWTFDRVLQRLYYNPWRFAQALTR